MVRFTALDKTNSSILEKVREGRPVETAYTHINDQCYNDENLKIKRILGECLLEERVMSISLSLRATKRERVTRHGENTQSSQFSLHNRL
ncbi:hypothetical protein F4679DRAFT_561736 [Xylaria curta]|nr:hypothetical protein F4679DRAFT_561736 [Xylaria curta]